MCPTLVYFVIVISSDVPRSVRSMLLFENLKKPWKYPLGYKATQTKAQSYKEFFDIDLGRACF